MELALGVALSKSPITPEPPSIIPEKTENKVMEVALGAALNNPPIAPEPPITKLNDDDDTLALALGFAISNMIPLMIEEEEKEEEEEEEDKSTEIAIATAVRLGDLENEYNEEKKFKIDKLNNLKLLKKTDASNANPDFFNLQN